MRVETGPVSHGRDRDNQPGDADSPGVSPSVSLRVTWPGLIPRCPAPRVSIVTRAVPGCVRARAVPRPHGAPPVF